MEERSSLERGTELGRIVHFSDAVFAIAITLLVLEIRVHEGLSPEELKDDLVGMWPQYLSYLISFGVIASFWRVNHLVFRYVRAYDGRLITLNLFFLMCVAFLPFSSSLLGEYVGQRIALEIYAGSVAVTGLFLVGMWWYATRERHLTDGNLDAALIRQIMTRCLISPAIALVVLPVTFFFGVDAAGYSVIGFLLIWLAMGRILPPQRTRPRVHGSENEHEQQKETKLGRV